ncbi:hypothetical protein L3049_17030 [Labilibaculum sp. DW002]|uniref:Uncharacterized protein n=1 Tax=Paralabilibaculum antarcticum TaxID=2912572 RepID=A0ABT5VZE7_9BACT|nr:hypothetical protein [Labilibaculum sp. DW002]MDE5419699.1 hypothetical protein [Labilibaculum sp. DW002]
MKILMTIIFAFLIISCKSNTEKQETKAVQLKAQISAQTVPNKQKSEVSKKTYTLNDIKITLTQAKSDGKEFYCKSRLLISRNNDSIDSLNFTSEPVGGHYGISTPIQIDNHLIFTKHGDYDGRTIIVDDKGEVFNIIGGLNYYDPNKSLLFTIYESDLSGFAVFDLKNDSLKFEMQEMEDYPISFHKAFGERYFILCNNEDADEGDIAIWEIEFELNRILQVDFDINNINEENILKTWKLEDVNCECDE